MKQLSVTGSSEERLERLKILTETSSMTEVVKNALRLYEALIEETVKGGKFFMEDKNGKMTRYKVFL